MIDENQADFRCPEGPVMVMLRPMKFIRTTILTFLFILLGPVSMALAACTDPPSPEVNWRRCVFDRLNFDSVDLTAAQLRDVSFFRASLNRAILDDVDAFRAKFVNAELVEASLVGANLQEADFTKADLSNAKLADADLRRARLFRVDLRGADLSGARLEGADLTQADLSGATWIDGERICAEGSEGRCN